MSKKLGQHFLINFKKIKQIIDYLNLNDGDVVIEIGPGKGALTKELGSREKNISIIAVERDKKLIDYLNQNVVSDIEKIGNNIDIKYGNILTKLPILSKEIEKFNKCKIIGNIPYYITGKLFRVLEKLETKPKKIILTIQREVADRVTASPPNMNILSASVQFWANVEKMINIPKKDFRPAPEVDSAVIKITPKKYDTNKTSQYYKLIKILFKHPRKTAVNNISIGLGIEKKDIVDTINNLGFDSLVRPQNIGVEKIKDMVPLLYNELKN